MSDLFEFRNIGIPAGHHWSTQRDGAQFGTSYLSRAAMAKANIFVNAPTETCYYYLDLDAQGARLHGASRYSITFPAGQLPPVNGFWSLTLYNDEHLFNANPLGRYSLGTKSKKLKYNADGSLTLYAGAKSPGADKESNWLPTPQKGPYYMVMRMYGPQGSLAAGSWQAPQPIMAK